MHSLNITIIQSDLHWEDKKANLDMFAQKINSIENETHIILLPEMFTTGFSMNTTLAETMDEETVRWMKKIASEKKVIICGSVMIKDEQKIYNRLLWVLPNGDVGKYDKRHLFAYAEEDKSFTSGDKRLITSVSGWRWNTQICYDLRFPIWARQQQKNNEPEYDVLLYVANWPERRSLAWKTLLQARAIENQCYVIGVNRVGKDAKDIQYSGDSCIINPMGEILYSKNNAEDIFTFTLEKVVLQSIRHSLPFLKDGDGFMVV
jgi:predicted amidohydrolase